MTAIPAPGIAMTRRLFAALLATASTIIAVDDAAAQSYPTRPLRLLVGYAPGGATDIVARTLATKLQETLAQPVIVENRAGAGSNIASEFVAKSAPDGHTLLLATIANATNMTAYRSPGYDALRDFSFITQAMSAPSVLAVHPSVAARNLRELLALARAQPG
jgi:tripartite-type tricarboxylate transporter receptor subunit TctC